MATRFTRPCVVRAAHVQDDGARQMKIVGKIARHREYGLVFFHAHSGTQYHGQTSCPAPLDVALLGALERSEMELIYVYDRRRELMWKIAASTIEANLGEKVPAKHDDGRHRIYPHEDLWEKKEHVKETLDKGWRTYTHAPTGRTVLRDQYLSMDVPENVCDLDEEGSVF